MASPSRALALVLFVMACGPTRSGAQVFAAPADLGARIDGGDVLLSWRHRASASTVYSIELGTPGSDFVMLGSAWPEGTRFRHEQVATDTTFVYRVVPFFGLPSDTVAITSGSVAGDEPGAALVEGPLDEARASDGAKASLRSALTLVAAAPTGLTARLSSADSVELRWIDRASDEDGYLVEAAPGLDDFAICALLPANTTSFRKLSLGDGMAWRFRVRAFFRGSPSRQVRITTPRENAAASR